MILTKSDVLSGFDALKVCVAYKVNGVETQEIPFDVHAEIEPVYKEFRGWKEDISRCSSFDQLPEELRNYIAFVEAFVNVPFSIISVSPDRAHTIVRN